jgi:hypothetical protein
MSGIEDAELNGVQDPHFERILRMFAYSCALGLLFCMDVTNLRLLCGKKMNASYLNTVLRKTFIHKRRCSKWEVCDIA